MRPVLLVGCRLWGWLILCDLRPLDVEVTVIDPDPRTREEALALGMFSPQFHILIRSGHL